MTEPDVWKYIVGATPDEVIDWDNDPRVQVGPLPICTVKSHARHIDWEMHPGGQSPARKAIVHVYD